MEDYLKLHYPDCAYLKLVGVQKHCPMGLIAREVFSVLQKEDAKPEEIAAELGRDKRTIVKALAKMVSWESVISLGNNVYRSQILQDHKDKDWYRYHQDGTPFYVKTLIPVDRGQVKNEEAAMLSLFYSLCRSKTAKVEETPSGAFAIQNQTIRGTSKLLGISEGAVSGGLFHLKELSLIKVFKGNFSYIAIALLKPDDSRRNLFERIKDAKVDYDGLAEFKETDTPKKPEEKVRTGIKYQDKVLEELEESGTEGGLLKKIAAYFKLLREASVDPLKGIDDIELIQKLFAKSKAEHKTGVGNLFVSLLAKEVGRLGLLD